VVLALALLELGTVGGTAVAALILIIVLHPAGPAGRLAERFPLVAATQRAVQPCAG
jgi:hypothetical protein